MATGKVVVITLEKHEGGASNHALSCSWSLPGPHKCRKPLVVTRKLWLPYTRQGLEWWWDLHPWRFFSSAGQGTDQLALALQPVLLGAEG